jgi:hypothetical protein
VVLIQIVAATLLLLGSALIFRALLALDAADQPKPASSPRAAVGRARPHADDDSALPRAA